EPINEEEKLIGTLSVGDGSENFITLPVHYDGYVYKPLPATQDTDIEEAVNTDVSDKNNSSQIVIKVLFIVTALLIVILIIFIIIKINHSKRKREMRKQISQKRQINNRR
ncbi:MAG: hypothetical protein IJ167_05480, partial [Lachnospiraceae bacterium]|nr:hypothetical protein [Lachnospiraceae bacterium]